MRNFIPEAPGSASHHTIPNIVFCARYTIEIGASARKNHSNDLVVGKCPYLDTMGARRLTVAAMACPALRPIPINDAPVVNEERHIPHVPQ